MIFGTVVMIALLITGNISIKKVKFKWVTFIKIGPMFEVFK